MLVQDNRSPQSEQLTELLRAWSAGDASAGEQLFEHLYPRLRTLAAMRLAGHDVSLQVTELVNELYVKITRSSHPDWQNRRHFLAIAARQMRQLIVDRARRKSRQKRGGDAVDLSLDKTLGVVGRQQNLDDILAIDQALSQLEIVHKEAAQVVELRFYAGFAVDETARILGISSRSIKRRWRFARAWLRRAIEMEVSSES